MEVVICWNPLQYNQKTRRGAESEPSGVCVVPLENPKAVLGSNAEPVKVKKRGS